MDIQNIFPLANSFAEVKMLGAGRNPNEENKGNIDSRLRASLNIPNSYMCETRPYLEFTATNRMSGNLKICGPRYLGPNFAKSAIFRIFFQFFKHN